MFDPGGLARARVRQGRGVARARRTAGRSVSVWWRWRRLALSRQDPAVARASCNSVAYPASLAYTFFTLSKYRFEASVTCNRPALDTQRDQSRTDATRTRQVDTRRGELER